MFRPAAVFCLCAVVARGDAVAWERLAPLPEAGGVAAPFAGVHGGALVVGGGANFPGRPPWDGGTKIWHDRVWVLEAPGGQWREAGRLPRPLAYGVSVSLPDGVICVGGSDASAHHPDVFRLSWTPGGLRTQPLPPLPIALANACGALVGATLYVGTGSEAPGERKATNRAFALDLAADPPGWWELPPLPGRGRLLTTAATHEERWLVFGGAALEPSADGTPKREYLREAWSYHADHGWRRLADLPRPRVAAPSPAPWVNGRLLLLSGDDGTLAGFTPLEKHPGFPKAVVGYDPVRDRWHEVGVTPAPRVTVPCVEWRGRFVLPSGEVRPGVRSPEVWSFFPRHP